MGNDRGSDPHSGFRAAWHIAYICAIFFIILIALIICLADDPVCDTAMTNVSFASTIVSIVLAVVSIVISLFAAFRTSENIGSMQDIANSISRSIKHLRKIKTIASDNNKRLAMLTADNFTKASPSDIQQKLEEEGQAIEETPLQRQKQSQDSKDIPLAANPQTVNSEASEQNSTQSQAQPLTLQNIEREAIAKVSNLLGFSDIHRGFRLRGVDRPTVFDGMHEAPGMLSLLEVKYVNTEAFAANAIMMFHHHIERISAKYDMAHTHFYLILVFRDNKQSFVDRHPFPPSLPNLTILYLNLNEL